MVEPMKIDDEYEYNPCHVAVMTEDPKLEVIQLVHEHFPTFRSSLNRNTSQHLAVCDDGIKQSGNGPASS